MGTLMPALRGQNLGFLPVVQPVIHLGIQQFRAHACCGSKTYAYATFIGMPEDDNTPDNYDALQKKVRLRTSGSRTPLKRHLIGKRPEEG